MKWVFDELLTEDMHSSGFPSLADVAQKMGHEVFRTKYVPFSHNIQDFIPYGAGSCVVTYGTVQFCRQVEREHGRYWTPGLYFNQNVKSFSKYSHHLGDDLLNSDYYILPFGEVRRMNFTWPAPGSVFIKPNSGMKEFTGQVIHWNNFKDDIRKLHGAVENNIDDDCLCVLAPPRDIKAEFRYIICERQVITGSEYRWDNTLDIRRDTHVLCDAMAWKIANAKWQADTVYVCDVALLDNILSSTTTSPVEIAKVVELNAFSCSGIYACDTYKIIEAVSKAAEREHNGDVE
jgi:hypothetical protein